MSSLRILTAAKTARAKSLRVQPPQLLVGGIQRVLIVPQQQPQQQPQQRDLSVGPSRPCCKSAVVVEATNMPLSHLHNLVSQQEQQQHQQHHQDRQERIPSPLLSTTAKSTTLKPTRKSHRNIFTNLNHTNSTCSSSSHNRQRLSMLAAAEDGRDDTTTTLPPPKSSSLKSKSPSMASSLALPADMSNKLNMMESLMAQGADVDMVELERLARLTPTPLRLGDMYKYAASGDRSQRLRNAQFLHRELPIRLAQRAHDLLSLPHGLSSESTPIRKVALMYSHYIHQLQALPSPTTDDEEDAFTALLHDMVLDRTSIPATIAKGLSEWLDDDDRRQEHVVDLQRHQEMEDALQRFFTARVGLRFLTEHHILSSPNPTLAGLRDSQTACSLSVQEQDRGCIQHDCNPVLECQKIAHEVARQTYDCYGVCPEIEIVDRQSARAQVFTYVPHHLHYMLAELLKNSCRASVERYMAAGGDKSSTKLTPVRVVIVKGAAEVTIKVSDQGGGIPRSVMARIFRFTHSTSRQETEKDTDFGTVEAGIQHMRGFGLPLARIYARYFGGELTLKSMEGYGLDAYLYLPRLGDACENLPPRVSSSPGELVSLPSIKPKNSNKMSLTSSTTTSSARTYSTMVPQQVRGEATVVAQQQHASSTPFVEPWVSDAEDGLDESDWEEAKMRRVLRILKMRAL